MAVIKNLCIVPALKVDASTWFPVPSWARITGAHASLPRSTAFSGTTAAQVVCSRADVVVGRYYVFTVSIRATAPQVGTLGIDWKTSGGTFLSTTSGAGSDFGVVNMTAGTTQRFGVIGLAPADAGRMDPVINGMDAGGAEVTAVMVREALTLSAAEDILDTDLVPSNYADGDSPGGVWDGADGESTSTITRDEPASGVAAFGALAAFGAGIRRSGNEATGVAAFGPLLASSGLIPTAQYDRDRGRIRVSAAGLAGTVVRVIVYRRALGSEGRWTEVRGGRVSVVAGLMVRPVDDREYPAGGGVEYKIDALSSLENQPEALVQSATVDVNDTEEQVWLKFIPAPWTDIPVELLVDDWELSQAARSEVHEIQGRTPPVVVSDVHGSTRTAVRFKTRTDEELRRLRRALGQGAPAYLQIPDSIPLPTMYVSIGPFVSRRWGGRTSRRYLTTVQIVEVEAPPLSVVPSSITWEVLADQYATWDDLAQAFETWADVVG